MLVVTAGVSPAAAANGPQGPTRVTQPATGTRVTIFPTPTPPIPPHAENPVLTLPAGPVPKAHIPIVPSVAAVTDVARDEVDVYAIDTRGALDVIRKIPNHTLDPTSGEPDGFWGPIGNIAGQPSFRQGHRSRRSTTPPVTRRLFSQSMAAGLSRSSATSNALQSGTVRDRSLEPVSHNPARRWPRSGSRSTTRWKPT